MSTPIVLRILATLILTASAAFAQRESFEASTVRVLESKEIRQKLDPQEGAPADSRVLERKGADAAGRSVTMHTTQRAVTFDDVFFKLSSTELRDDRAAAQLSEMLKALESDDLKTARFLVEAHCCDLGSPEYNLKLSADRAQAIKDYLVRAGIASERLAILGCGEGDPAVRIDRDGTASAIEEQRSRNRRVILRQLPPAGK